MTDGSRLGALARLAGLLRERDLTRVKRAAEACQRSQSRLSALAKPVPLVDDPAAMTARQAHIAWARDQRAHVLQSLALDKATLADARATAARSFARAQVLERLARVRK
jgi:hypothetical protein